MLLRVATEAVKRLQPRLNARTPMPVSLSLIDACSQSNFKEGNFPPPVLEKACEEWMDEHDVLEEVLLDAVAALDSGQQLDAEDAYQAACWERSTVCVGANLDIIGEPEMLIGEGDQQQVLKDNPAAEAELEDMLAQRTKEKDEKEANEREKKRKMKRYTDDRDAAVETDRQCLVCLAVTQEIVKKLQALLYAAARHPVSLSVADPCSAENFKMYDFASSSNSSKQDVLLKSAQQGCNNWLNAYEDDLQGGSVIENVFAHAVQQLSHLPSEKQQLNGTALKEELCYSRTPVCVDVMYVNAVAGPPLKANVSASQAKPARPNAEKRAEMEKKKKPVLTPEQKAEKAEKARIRRERAAWEKGFKRDAKFWQRAQKCVVCRTVVKAS